MLFTFSQCCLGTPPPPHTVKYCIFGRRKKIYKVEFSHAIFFLCSILVTNVRNLFSAYTCIVVHCIKFSYVGWKVRLKYLHNLEPISRLKVYDKEYFLHQLFWLYLKIIWKKKLGSIFINIPMYFQFGNYKLISLYIQVKLLKNSKKTTERGKITYPIHNSKRGEIVK